MNHAQMSVHYGELATQEMLAADWRADVIRAREEAAIRPLTRWIRGLKDEAVYKEYVNLRVGNALGKDRQYKTHIGLQRHYLRLSNWAANQAFLKGELLVPVDEEETW